MYDLNLKVLVVDDMLTMRKLVTKALKEIGFTQFTEAGDGAKAWEAVTAPGASIGLIVSDWNMPNSTGVDLLKRVRADGRFKALPFFLVTAESEKSQIVEALKAGVTGYIVKPFDTATLKKQLEDSSAKAAA
jgi:two-component system chemotaxis response regulator CheY